MDEKWLLFVTDPTMGLSFIIRLTLTRNGKNH